MAQVIAGRFHIPDGLQLGHVSQLGLVVVVVVILTNLHR